MEGSVNKQELENNMNRIQIVSMLFDGAVKFIKTARNKLEAGDSTGTSLYLGKTTAIIKELSNSVNVEGGDVSRNLRSLYDYVLSNLHKAGTQGDMIAIDDAEKVIQILRSGWKEMQEAGKV